MEFISSDTNVWLPCRTELNALVLMGTFPHAAGFLNRKGQLPLHMACSQRESSHVTVFKLLEIHRMMNLPIDLRDLEGMYILVTSRAVYDYVIMII